MLLKLLILISLIFAVPPAFGGEVENANDLRKLLMAGHKPAKIEIADSKRFSGPNPSYYSIDTDGLSILYRLGLIKQENGKRIKMVQHGPGNSKDMPEMDWDPIGGKGFKVFRAGERWGTCLEFSHAGIGKSGRFQRWTSVVLVPWRGSKPSTVAHRFVGYWAGCYSLMEGEKSGEILLPIIEPVEIGSKRLHLVWNHCTFKKCDQIEDKRPVLGDPNSESGRLLINR